MNDLELKIYEHYKSNRSYHYSSDMKQKKLEVEAIESLSEQGYITIKTQAIGYVIADVCI